MLAGGIAVLTGVVLLENLGGRVLYELLLRLPGVDKALHWVQYTAIFLIIWRLARGTRLSVAAKLGVAAAATVAIGVADELVQGQFARRSMELADLAVDAAGALAGVAIVAVPGRRGLQGLLLTVSLAVTGVLGYRTYDLLKDYNRGLLSERQRDFVSARTYYQRALARGHRSAGLFNSLAWVEVESGIGDAAAAVRYAEQGLAIRPGDGDLLDTYGWALHHAGRSREALVALERAVAAKPGIYCVHYHLGAVQSALGRPAAARRHFEEQIRLFPQAAEAGSARAALTGLPQDDD